MEMWVHTSEGELKVDGPILSLACSRHPKSAVKDATPVPCVFDLTPCQCGGCIYTTSHKSSKITTGRITIST